MAGVPERRVATGREHAGQHLVVAVHGHRDRYAHLDLQAALHVDHVVLPERRSGGRDAPLPQPGEHTRVKSWQDRPDRLHGDVRPDRDVRLGRALGDVRFAEHAASLCVVQ
jgi:hypothetical protein